MRFRFPFLPPAHLAASYALRTIHGIVNEAQLLHVALQPAGSPFPAVLPMLGTMASFERPSADEGDVLDLYLHGYVSSRLVNVARDQAGQGGAGEGPTEQGLALTVAASHVDGLVLALSPNAHSYNYRSAVLFGHATVVTDVAEKLFAMERITDGVVPGRWRHTRVPPNAAEMQSTSVLRVRIATGSAKIRTGSAADDRGDLQDDAVLDSVWAGVVPVYTALGTPQPAPHNRVADVPDYLEQFRVDFNARTEEAAVAAAAPVDSVPATSNVK